MRFMQFSQSTRLFLCMVSVVGLSGLSAYGAGDHDSADVPVIGDGQSKGFYAPHHTDATPPHGPTPHPATGGTHYFAETGDASHFAWGSVTPATPGPIVVKYDFRDVGGFDNLITPAEKTIALAALSAWSSATGGKLSFVLDMAAPASSIINIGTGDLAAVHNHFVSGPGGTLGLGGGDFDHAGTHAITGGIAWQDHLDTWDTTIGNGNPSGTFDYFTVVTQEIGHALGLGHAQNEGGLNMMNGTYSGEQTTLSAVDISHITSVYGAFAVPEPGTLILLGTGLMLVVSRRRKA